MGDPVVVRFRDGLGPHIVAAVAGLVVYILATQLFTTTPAAKSVVGGVLVAVFTMVGTLIARALLSEARARQGR